MPITDANRDNYRQLFSAVFADFYLFDNLLGTPSPELDAQAQEYLSLLHLEHKVKVKTKKVDRGPLLIISGEKDHTVPWAIANAAYKRQRRNPGVTEIVKVRNRGHSLTIDHGWREVADTALKFVQRFA